MEKQFLIAGFGGQGVLLIGQLIAKAAMRQGYEVSWMPSYGPEMRGGEANCAVVVSDEPIGSPLVSEPPVLVAMNKPSLYKFVNRVKPGGTIIVNSSLIPDKVERDDVKVVYIDAQEIAMEAGNARTANIVVLGAYMGISQLFPTETVKKMIEGKFASKPKVIPANLKAFDLGYAAASK